MTSKTGRQHGAIIDSDANRHSPPANAGRRSSLAARVASWTSRLVVSAMILVAGVGFARQVLCWWYEKSPRPANVAAGGAFLSPGHTQWLTVAGHDWTIARREAAAPAERALETLSEFCLAASRATEPARTPLTAAERRFVERLQSQAPLRSAGDRRAYHVDQPLPTVVVLGASAERAGENVAAAVGMHAASAGIAAGINRAGSAAGGAAIADGQTHIAARSGTVAAGHPGPAAIGGADQSASSEHQLESSAPRVLTWGIGLPAGPERWTLFAFQHASGFKNSLAGEAIPLPPGARRSMTIGGDNATGEDPSNPLGAIAGAELIEFSGVGDAGAWRQFFDDWSKPHGWRGGGKWTSSGTGWTQHYQREADGGSVDIHIRKSSPGKSSAPRLEGLIVVGAAESGR